MDRVDWVLKMNHIKTMEILDNRTTLKRTNSDCKM